MPHNFSYEVKQPEYGNYYGHEVVANEEQINGRYFVLLPDGQVMTVTYVADHDGFRPEIEFEPFVKEGMFAQKASRLSSKSVHTYRKSGPLNFKLRPSTTLSSILIFLLDVLFYMIS